jgi:SAM-dependent methyltransferase
MDPDLLSAGSRSHYEDAAYYDQIYRRRREDVRFYLEHIRAALGDSEGPVLELGVGTGRVALALARDGIAVVGVDAMRPMLDRFEARLEREPKRVREKVTLRQGDLTTLDLGDRFAVVTSPFHVLNHCYTRQEIASAFDVVRAHLAPGGHFLFDVRVPNPDELRRDPEKVYKGRDVTLPSTGRRYHYRERWDYHTASQIQTVEMAFVGVDDPSDFHLQLLTHRCWFPAELEAILHYEGFTILERFGDFEGEPLDEGHDSQVFLCRLRS